MRIDGKLVLVTFPLLLLFLGLLGCSSPELADEEAPVDVGDASEDDGPPRTDRNLYPVSLGPIGKSYRLK